MALPFLPHHEIPRMFRQLKLQAADSRPLRKLTAYVKRQWIKNAVFSPKDWSVYRQPIRTNNDIEGWHHALNRRAGGKSNLPLYILIELLHREAKLTAITVRLVSDNKLKRIQRKVYRQVQTKLFASWDKYDNREKTAAQLLKCCAKLNGPARVQ